MMLSGVQHNADADKGGVLLGSFAGLGALLLVFLLYLNKRRRWWGGTPGANLHVPVPLTKRRRCLSHDHLSIRRPSSPVSIHHTDQPLIDLRREKLKIGKTWHLDASDSSSETESLASTAKVTVGLTPPPVRAAVPIPPQANIVGPFYRVTVPPRTQRDLMSLVEKGKVAVSSNSSCCSSTTSSVGDRHANRENNNLEITQAIITHEIRETKIDNQDDNVKFLPKDQMQKCIDSTDINSNRDCIVIMNSESFDAQSCISAETDVQSVATATAVDSNGSPSKIGSLTKRGVLEIALLYDAPMRKMTVHVLQAREIQPHNSDKANQPIHTQVRLLMLPSKKQKHKTKIRSGSNPQYMESFLLHKVNPEDVNSMGIRLRVYGCEKMRRERLIGEAVVSFANINLELENNLWLNLEARANTQVIGSGTDLMSLARSDSTSSTHSMQHGGVPELLLGLAYNPVTGGLAVEVIKGSYFRNLSVNRAPDSYIKLSLVSSTGQLLAHSKTSVKRGQPNPLFKETFIFQVALFQLADVTLVISVYNRRGVTKRKEMLGWFSLGLNSSGAEELAHWMDMKDCNNEQLARWHVLILDS